MGTVQDNKGKPGGKEITVNSITFECNEKEGVKVLAGAGTPKEIIEALEKGIGLQVASHTCKFDKQKGIANREENGVVRPANKEKMEKSYKRRRTQGRSINSNIQRDEAR